MAKSFVFAAALVVLGTSALAQDPPPKPGIIVGQREVDKAVKRGVEYLKKVPSSPSAIKGQELILLTLISAEVPDTNPDFDRVLKSCLSAPLAHTYNVALLAMALQEYDATGYQMKIAQCAQFLVDTQCANGQWSYGGSAEAAKLIPFEEPQKKVASGPKGAREFGSARGEQKKPTKRYEVKQTKKGGASGDNSNSQYGCLGLRACFEANIKIPEEVLYLARTWWVDSQCPDESGGKAGANAVASGGPTSKIQGWNYTKPGEEGKAPYHAMTAGGVGAVCIIEYMLGKDFKKDGVTQAGVNWLGKHFAVNTNYYYMYGLERAGMLYGADTFGGRLWYTEGARLLLDNQNEEGSWGKRENKDENAWDTCFAILFLKKATRAIATGGGK